MAIAERDATGRPGAAVRPVQTDEPDGRGVLSWVIVVAVFQQVLGETGLLNDVLGDAHLAAPFGTEEYELNHFGVEATHFTRDKNGSPIATQLGLVENPVQLPITYLCDAPRVLYLPGRPDVVQRNHAWQLKVAPMLVRNPAFGLQSETTSRAGAAIDTLRTDTAGSIVAGRKPLSAWDDTVKKMRDQGLDPIAEEYAKDHAANH